MSRQYTMTEIAKDWELWCEYVDPHATMTRDEFDAMTVVEKYQLQRELFPDEAAAEDAINATSRGGAWLNRSK